MYKKTKLQTITILLLLIIFTLACASVQVGIVTPTSEEVAVSMDDTEEPTVGADTNQSTEDFSHLWVEYWNPVFDYGLAIPSHWRVETESQGGFMMLWSYEQEFFEANSIKGWWIGDEAPEGVVKMDFVPFENVVPEQSLDIAISNILGADPEMTVVLSVEKIDLGNFDAVQVTTARPDNDLDDTTTSIAIRLSPDVILFVAAYPDNFYELSDVKTILGSLVLNKNTPIIKPTTAPHPPLVVDSTQTNPPAPEAQLSNSACDSGYLGSVEEIVEVIQYNLEIGNYYPFSYLIGDPFAIGYFRSEGVSMPRDQAYQQLTDYFLPSPEEVFVTADKAEYPSDDKLYGASIENMWGPDVDIAASLYSTGWGEDGTQEAIIAIARCQDGDQEAYYWYGMLYGRFE